MFHLILFNPQIPQNTGNIGRMCAITQCTLHLIHPLGFEIQDKYLRRSGMDYWKELTLHHHENWDAFKASGLGPAPENKLWLLSTHATNTIWQTKFNKGDGLVFGNEGHGAPDWLHKELTDGRVTVPQFHPNLRSINLATAAGIVTYEALRQCSV